MSAVAETRGKVGGIVGACSALGLPRATYYRRLHPKPPEELTRATEARRAQPRALHADERRDVLAVLNEARFADLAAPQVYATLLDEGRRLCSLRTMYRVLDANRQVRDRRDQLRHPEYKKPELMATGPNQVWTWDITKLLGPAKWTYFYLYVILDIFSRYVVGWTVATSECSAVAKALIEETCRRQGIGPDQLTLHADRGSPMVSKPVAFLLADLAVTKSHSRPHVSDDNPFSEAQFKTLKYRPGFPERFGSADHSKQHCRDFFPWYNTEHRHSSLGFHTAHDVHHRLAEQKRAQRIAVLDAAFRAHPERFPLGPPKPPALPSAVWINKPSGHLGAAAETAPSNLVVLAAPSGGSIIEAH